MKYHQPFDQPNAPNAPYVNGNPSTGTPGSIPPAASIEYPQRELVNFTTDCGLTPDDGDLHQLSRSVQSGKVYFGVDTSTTSNVITTSLIPAPTSLKQGMMIHVFLANDISGPTTAIVNGLGPYQVVGTGNTQFGQGAFFAGDVLKAIFDGTKLQVSNPKPPGAVTILTHSLTWYVGGAGASDSNDGQSASASPGGHGPWATLAKAASQVPLYNLNNQQITINIANGTYNVGSAPVSWPTQNGSGVVTLQGNHASPGSVTCTASLGTVFVFGGGTWQLDGMTITAPNPNSGDAGNGINSGIPGASVVMKAINFGPCAGAHMEASLGGQVSLYGPIVINSGANATAHMQGSSAGQFNFAVVGLSGSTTLNILGPVTFSVAFAQADVLSQINGYYYGGTTGGGNVTGKRYTSNSNSIINSNGGGSGAYPGTIAGTTSSGGQFI